MASKNGNGKYGSDRANAVAATFGPVDKQLNTITTSYSDAASADERNEIRQAVLDHVDPETMSKDRIRDLYRAVGIVDPHEAEQLAVQEWNERFPVILSEPVNTRGAEIRRQMAGLEDRRNRGIQPYNDLGAYIMEQAKLQAEEARINEEFENGPMAAYRQQQEEMAEFGKAYRAEYLGRAGSSKRLFVADDADERDINSAMGRLDAAAEAQLAGTPGVKEMRAAESPEEVTRILAGLGGIEVEPKGAGTR